MAFGPILPYLNQTPQDYTIKNAPVVTSPEQVIPTTPAASAPDATTGTAVSNGGVYYGDQPPSNPQYGWLWTRGKGLLYMYIEPGIWQQVGTNW